MRAPPGVQPNILENHCTNSIEMPAHTFLHSLQTYNIFTTFLYFCSNESMNTAVVLHNYYYPYAKKYTKTNGAQ